MKGILDVLDPKSVMRRGYAICKGTDGEIIFDQSQLNLGDDVCILFMRGEIGAKVESKKA